MALEDTGGRQTIYGQLPEDDKFGSAIAGVGREDEVHYVYSFDDLPAVDADNRMVAVIPAGSIITEAYIKVLTAMDGTTGTMTIGTYQSDGGGVIDVDGIDATVAQAALLANVTIVCDGDQVGGGIVLAEETAVVVVTGGTVTAGKFELIIKYIT